MAFALVETLGERLRALRKARGWTLQEMGENTGMVLTTIWTYETGRGNPSIRALVKLADALDCSTDYLLGRTDTPS